MIEILCAALIGIMLRSFFVYLFKKIGNMFDGLINSLKGYLVQGNNVSEESVQELDTNIFRDELFRQLGAEVVEYVPEKDQYTINYLDAVFIFSFHKNKRVFIAFPHYYSCEADYADACLPVLNEINGEYPWCHYFIKDTQNNEIGFCCTYFMIFEGTVQMNVSILKRVLTNALTTRPEIIERINRGIEDNNNIPLLLNSTHGKIHSRRLQMEAQIGLQSLQATSGGNAMLNLKNILAIAPEIDQSTIKRARLITDDDIVEIKEFDPLLNTDIRSYLIQMNEKATLNRLTLLIDLDDESLTFDLKRQSDACTDTKLYYKMVGIRNRQSVEIGEPHIDTIIEVNLNAKEGEDEWEYKYMLDEAREKQSQGTTLTTEQRYALACLDDDIASNIYWGIKYYNNNNKLQALLHLTKALNSIPIDDGSHGEINLYNSICYNLGSIYIEMEMFDKAYYYLSQLPTDRRGGVERAISLCMQNMNHKNDVSIVAGYRTSILEKMRRNNDEEDFIYLFEAYTFVNRCYILILLKRNKVEEAKSLLHDMIGADEDTNFAKDFLNMINGENSEQE